jgi:hypothetical protein
LVFRKNDDADRAFDLVEDIPGPYGRIVPGAVGVEREEQPGGVQIGDVAERADLWTGEGGATPPARCLAGSPVLGRYRHSGWYCS